MVRRSVGIRACTRMILRKHPRERGMPPVTHTLKKFEIGEKANIVINPSIHGGMPHRRFHGNTGTVVKTQGRAYLIEVMQGRVVKHVLCAPEHLTKVK